MRHWIHIHRRSIDDKCHKHFTSISRNMVSVFNCRSPFNLLPPCSLQRSHGSLHIMLVVSYKVYYWRKSSYIRRCCCVKCHHSSSYLLTYISFVFCLLPLSSRVAEHVEIQRALWNVKNLRRSQTMRTKNLRFISYIFDSSRHLLNLPKSKAKRRT